MAPGFFRDRATQKLLVLLLMGILVLLALRFSPLREWLALETLKAFFEAIRREPWAPLIFILCYAGGLALAFPASPFILVGGVVFGVWPGAAYVWLGTTTGSALAFFVGRHLGRPFVEKWMGARLQKLDRAVAAHAFSAVLTLRLIPIIPFNLSNFALGVTGVAFPAYIVATAVAMAPGLVITTWFASELWLGTSGGAAWRSLGLATVCMLLLSTLPWLYQVYKRRREVESDNF